MTPLNKGTHVKLNAAHGDHPAGAVGVIARLNGDGTARVDFPDGTHATFPEDALVQRKISRREALLPARDPRDFAPYIQYTCVVGSRAFGLDTESSDTDLRGFYLPPARDHWSLRGVPEQLEWGEEAYWEIGKFLTLGLKGNPNILECLYTPLVTHATPLARELLDLRGAFLSTNVYDTYNGYVLSQFAKLEADWRTVGAPRPKHAMHLIRLLLSGIAVLEGGEVMVHVGAHRDALLDIKAGRMPWEDVNAWRLRLHRQFDDARTRTRLPEHPDVDRVNAYLLRAREHARTL
ncbi:nucleotidyltransferase domain-containing protein [Deinococcus maricopensis]|uniref:Nucleotidyltransferase n=1 Tax=Deinococcus maricopensis (strain DSM 21211 / LMG 22137 / NRRL B-23946 / LB-34) TaxID=709986 RepID=E8U4N8_DEIML|nr:nucleotidyltransferase domain-containing protein [Deinococcus maricopensis]ADV68903.1 Nucleotidyltransferase [Deinococcus maricopensis DSM 21211]